MTPTGLSPFCKFNQLGLANGHKSATALRGVQRQKANVICATEGDGNPAPVADHNVRKHGMAMLEYRPAWPTFEPIGNGTLHQRLTADVIRKFPSAQTRGFFKCLRAAIGDDELERQTFVPDAFTIDADRREVTVFEVEVTCPISEKKLLDMGWLWFQLDADDWDLRLVTIDRRGTPSEFDMLLAYREVLEADALPKKEPNK